MLPATEVNGTSQEKDWFASVHDMAVSKWHTSPTDHPDSDAEGAQCRAMPFDHPKRERELMEAPGSRAGIEETPWLVLQEHPPPVKPTWPIGKRAIDIMPRRRANGSLSNNRSQQQSVRDA